MEGNIGLKKNPITARNDSQEKKKIQLTNISKIKAIKYSTLLHD